MKKIRRLGSASGMGGNGGGSITQVNKDIIARQWRGEKVTLPIKRWDDNDGVAKQHSAVKIAHPGILYREYTLGNIKHTQLPSRMHKMGIIKNLRMDGMRAAQILERYISDNNIDIPKEAPPETPVQSNLDNSFGFGTAGKKRRVRLTKKHGQNMYTNDNYTSNFREQPGQDKGNTLEDPELEGRKNERYMADGDLQDKREQTTQEKPSSVRDQRDQYEGEKAASRVRNLSKERLQALREKIKGRFS